MTTITLSRIGRRKLVVYQVVVCEQRGRRNRTLEVIGRYSPHNDWIRMDLGRIQHWLSVGAQMSDAVEGVLKKAERTLQKASDVDAEKAD